MTGQSTPMTTRRRAAIDRATAKAHEQARQGNLPAVVYVRAWSNGVTRWRYSLSSRTNGKNVWLIDVTDNHGRLTTACDCPAIGVCWHRASVRLAHTGALRPHPPATVRPLDDR
jgi:hypothetical protein